MYSPTSPTACGSIEFAPLRSGSDVAAAVAATLGLDDSDRLERYVAQRRMLLLFDNCEHVIDDAATVRDERASSRLPA